MLLLPLVLVSALLAAEPEANPAGDPVADAQEYRVAASRALRDPDAQVRLALWCEARGMTAERLKHLALALLANPAHPVARGLMGLVADEGGRWRKPEAVAARVQHDGELSATLAEYNRRREAASETEDSQWRLALWCEEHGLKPEATAHLTAVTRINPKREAAWRRLGFTRQKDGRWANEEQVAAAKVVAESRRQADKRWRPLLTSWRASLGKPERSAEAEVQLNGLTDPDAVPSIWRVFATGKEADQRRAVQLLGQVQSPEASQALAFLAVASPSADVRRLATETLRRRDAREFLGMVIALVRKPLKYEVRMVEGPESDGVLFLEGEKYNVRRLYSLPLAAQIPRLYGTRATIDDPYYGAMYITGFRDEYEMFGWGSFPAIFISTSTSSTLVMQQKFAANQRDAQIMAQEEAIHQSTLQAQEQMRRDVAAIKAANASIKADNERTLMVLETTTGQKFGENPQTWQAWWLDQQGYAYSRPQSIPTIELAEEQPVNYFTEAVRAVVHHSCFGAGTMVRTLEGLRPIETLRAGDRVLGQDTTTGSLAFRPVLAIFHNAPAPTLKLTLDGQAPVVVTGIHRFWKPGQGWVMARELKVGDPVRTLGGTSRVTASEPEKIQPVYNMEIAEDHDFFVGEVGALVHDNSLVAPVAAPFDTPTKALASSASKR